MLHSSASYMLLTVTYTSHSQLLKPLFFLDIKKSSGKKLREESSQDYKSASKKKKKKKGRGRKEL